MASSTVQEVDNGLYRVTWSVDIKSSLEVKRLNFRLDRLPPTASCDVLVFCSFNEMDEENKPSFELRFRFWQVDSSKGKWSDERPKVGGKLTSVWTSVNGGDRHDLKQFPGGSWNSEGLDVVVERKTARVQIWLQFQVADRGEIRALNQLAELLTKQSNCDVHFTLGDGERVGAHALILAARSPVFAAMFAHDAMMEAQTRSVRLDDVQPDVFRSFLHYVYRGKLSEPLTEETVQPLYSIADKYAIDDLKADCIDWLLGHVRIENAVPLLAWAHLHAIDQLEEAALEFIARHGKEICPLADWEQLIKNYPQLSLIASRRMMENMVLANKCP